IREPSEDDQDTLEEFMGRFTKTRKSGKKKNPAAGQKRLTFRIDVKYDEIDAYEQVVSANGKWTKGRKVALKRIYENELEYLTAADRAISRFIEFSQERNYYGYYEVSYSWNYCSELWLALSSHPYVFDSEDLTRTIEIKVIQSYLQLSEKKGLTTLEFCGTKEGLNKDGPGRFNFYQASDEFRQLHKKFPKGKVSVPKHGKQRLLDFVKGAAEKIPLNSELKDKLGDAKEIKAEKGLLAALSPLKGGGLSVSFKAQPLGQKGPEFKPGHGSVRVVAEKGGKSVECLRNLKQEKKELTRILSAHELLNESNECDFSFEESSDSLSVLHYLKQQDVTLLWPKGKQIEISQELDTKDLSLQVRNWQQWFDIDGEISFGDEVLALAQVLEKLQDSPSEYIKISDKLFLKVSDRLRLMLEGLDSLKDKRQDKVLINRLFIQELTDFTDTHAKLPATLKKEQRRISKIFSETQPLPATFEAELRPYQHDGFQWLHRLSQWGAGACLADDMGLGKTIQALALLLDRAPLGPSLIIVPSSVTFNWIEECQRFTPTLNARPYLGRARKKILAELQPYDILICSYDILVRDIVEFKKKKWNCLVLDEAQAIKNEKSQRSKTVKSLDADFRLAMTGTPIENHLGELWSLFDFLNPGLLGDSSSFTEDYRKTIEVDKNERCRESLRRKVSPFILRRLKRDVLKELPARTEVSL
ncbi:MAG: DEAD/DEAH box helicase, partial [Lentisphaeraceae bacterium]|nr:DEAD/DEAH box helicase [Lentisphaeraceae bacterium]